MTDDAIERFEGRARTANEEALDKWFDEQRLKSVDSLEEGARQIITLVTALQGTLFAVLGLGSEKVAATLSLPSVLWLGVLTVAALLIAMLAALYVVLPRHYAPLAASPSDKAATFKRMLALKSNWLTTAVFSFAIGTLGFVALILFLLAARPSP